MKAVDIIKPQYGINNIEAFNRWHNNWQTKMLLKHPNKRVIEISKACGHTNLVKEPDYDYDSDVAVYMTTCADCGAVYNDGEDLWYE